MQLAKSRMIKFTKSKTINLTFLLFSLHKSGISFYVWFLLWRQLSSWKILKKIDNERGHNTEACSRNHCCSWKTLSVTYWESVFVALGTQHATRKRRILMCPATFYNIFNIISQTARFFGKMLLNTRCVFWFSLQLLSGSFLVLRRIQRVMIKNVNRSACKALIILVRI